MNTHKLKLFICAAATALTAFAAAPATAADVGVSISVGHPGFFGRIDVGDYYPRPHLLYPRPIVAHGPMHSWHTPIYLRVPPGHAKHWSRHCGAYNACYRPVYFVHDRWYNDVYVPIYRKRHAHHHRWDHDRRWDGRDHDRRWHDRDHERHWDRDHHGDNRWGRDRDDDRRWHDRDGRHDHDRRDGDRDGRHHDRGDHRHDDRDGRR